MYSSIPVSYTHLIWRTVDEFTNHETHKLVSCHLGSGASLCAIEDGQCMDTTMGLTPLDGLVMGTRCGTVDPATVSVSYTHLVAIAATGTA